MTHEPEPAVRSLVEENFINRMSFEETELILLWAHALQRVRQLTHEEQRLRRLVFAQHCRMFLKENDHESKDSDPEPEAPDGDYGNHTTREDQPRAIAGT